MTRRPIQNQCLSSVASTALLLALLPAHDVRAQAELDGDHRVVPLVDPNNPNNNQPGNLDADGDLGFGARAV